MKKIFIGTTFLGGLIAIAVAAHELNIIDNLNTKPPATPAALSCPPIHMVENVGSQSVVNDKDILSQINQINAALSALPNVKKLAELAKSQEVINRINDIEQFLIFRRLYLEETDRLKNYIEGELKNANLDKEFKVEIDKEPVVINQSPDTLELGNYNPNIPIPKDCHPTLQTINLTVTYTPTNNDYANSNFIEDTKKSAEQRQSSAKFAQIINRLQKVLTQNKGLLSLKLYNGVYQQIRENNSGIQAPQIIATVAVYKPISNQNPDPNMYTKDLLPNFQDLLNSPSFKF